MTGAMGTGGHTVGMLGEWRLLREWAAGGWLRRGQLDVEPQGGAAGLGVGTRVSSNGTRGGRAGTGMVLGDGIRDALRTWGGGDAAGGWQGWISRSCCCVGRYWGGIEGRYCWPC